MKAVRLMAFLDGHGPSGRFTIHGRGDVVEVHFRDRLPHPDELGGGRVVRPAVAGLARGADVRLDIHLRGTLIATVEPGGGIVRPRLSGLLRSLLRHPRATLSGLLPWMMSSGSRP